MEKWHQPLHLTMSTLRPDRGVTLHAVRPVRGKQEAPPAGLTPGLGLPHPGAARPITAPLSRTACSLGVTRQETGRGHCPTPEQVLSGAAETQASPHNRSNSRVRSNPCFSPVPGKAAVPGLEEGDLSHRAIPWRQIQTLPRCSGVGQDTAPGTACPLEGAGSLILPA